MRAVIALFALGLACSNSEKAGAEEARRQAEAEQKAKQAEAPAKKLAPPVPGEAHVPCGRLIDAPAFQTALGEKDSLVVKEVTKNDAEAAAACSLVRGGKRPTEAEQKALIKKAGKLGVLPGDELCNVTAYCRFITDVDRLRATCKARKDHDDDSMGSYACVHIVAVGSDDVKVFQFVDEDTRCILQVRGGPSNVDNELIRSCAKAARDTIGPAQIRVDAPAAGSGSDAAGSATGPAGSGS